MGCTASTQADSESSAAASEGAREGASSEVRGDAGEAAAAAENDAATESVGAPDAFSVGVADASEAEEGSKDGCVQGVGGDVEAHIEAVAEKREEWMASIQERVGGASTRDVDVVLDGVEKLVDLVRRTCSTQGRDSGVKDALDIQSLQLSRRTPLEQGFAKYSALGQVIVNMAGPALTALPFGAPAAAAIGAVYARASLAARLSHNCEMLLGLLKIVDAQLARVLDSLVKRKVQPPAQVESALQQLLVQVIEGGRLMQDYAQQGFVMRFILGKGDARKFAMLDKGIQHAMELTSFSVSMDFLASPASYQSDESAALRSAVCAAAGMPEAQAEQALCVLSQSQPGQLQALIQQHGSFSAHVIAVELGAIAERVAVLEQQMHVVQGEVKVVQGEVKVVQQDVQVVQVETQMVGSRVALIEKQLAQAASRQEEATLLAGYLKEWWVQTLGKRTKSVPVDVFFSKLIQWFKDKNLLDQLLEYEQELQTECFSDKLLAASKKICVEEGGRVLNFLSLVILPLLDTNQDDKVDRTELRSLQITSEDFANRTGEPKPKALTEMLDVIFLGFSQDAVLKRVAYSASTPEISIVAQALKVRDIIKGYSITTLLESHVPGTRQWLFDRVNKWLDAALRADKDTASLSHHRAFLLLAGPGMGKSVFSAVMEKKMAVHMQSGQKLIQVRHFFKVGEPRAQGKAMVLCLAQQLAEQLPGMAAALKPVVEEHGCAEQLSLLQSFEKYLLEPLTALDEDQQHVVVMLLDALDEAADGAAGCEAVASIVGFQMTKLPAWVKMILTGRPQMEPYFQAWEPDWIQPSDKSNQEDMSMLLAARLQQGSFVLPVDLAASVDVMLQKSQGQFIWSKYAFDTLSSRDGSWTPAEIEAALPNGLSGVFSHIMSVLQDALQEEQPDTLALLRQRVLPILVASKAPLTPQQLAVMAGAEQAKVDQLLRLLVNMFPTRMQQGSLKVFPYHKSVLDWLVEGPSSAVDVGVGHACAGKACFTAVIAARSSSRATASSDVESSSILEYALRYGVAHLCLAGSCIQQLEGLLLDVSGFWPQAFAQGCGAEVLSDLIALGPKASEVVKDVIRWLRLTSSYLMEHPRAALQLACDAPRNSLVAKHANCLPERPQAVLLTKEDNWSACLSVLTGHAVLVESVALSADARVCVSGSYDCSIRVWDLQTGACTATLEGHTDWVKSVALSADARICVSGSWDKSIRVWDLQIGACTATLEGHTSSVISVALSADARVCVSGSKDESIRVWDLQTGACTATLEGHTGDVMSVALSADARICVSGSEDKSIRVWDLQTGACTATLKGHTSWVYSVALSADARICVSGSADKSIRVWDLQTGACTATLEGHTGSVYSVALSADARVCVSGSADVSMQQSSEEESDGDSEDESEEEESEQEPCKKGSGAPAAGMRVAQKQAQQSKTRKGESSEEDSDGDSEESSEEEEEPRKRDKRASSSSSSSSSSTPAGKKAGMPAAGKKVAAPAARQRGAAQIRVWDLQTGACTSTLEGHTDLVKSVALSADACVCVSGSSDKSIRVWDLQTGACTANLEGHTSYVTSVALSADARVCVSGSGYGDMSIRVWDLETGACMATLEGHTGDVISVALSADARVCVSGSGYGDRSIRVWDLETGACTATLDGHTSSVNSVALSADARVCVSSGDNSIRKWDVVRSMQLACFHQESPEGVQLKAEADSWRNVANKPDGVMAWGGHEGRVFHWGTVEARSSAAANLPAAYLMPPAEVGEHGVFYNSAASGRTVSFFEGQSDAFLCYQLLG